MGQGDPGGEYKTLTRPIAVRCFPFREIPLDEPPTPLARAVEVIESIFCCTAFSRFWRKADMSVLSLNVRFSNRPSRVKRFQAIHQLQCRCRSRARASLRTRHQGPFHHGDSKTRWNNLSGDLAVNVTAGSTRRVRACHGATGAKRHDQDNPSRDRDAQIGCPKNNGLLEE